MKRFEIIIIALFIVLLPKTVHSKIPYTILPNGTIVKEEYTPMKEEPVIEATVQTRDTIIPVVTDEAPVVASDIAEIVNDMESEGKEETVSIDFNFDAEAETTREEIIGELRNFLLAIGTPEDQIDEMLSTDNLSDFAWFLDPIYEGKSLEEIQQEVADALNALPDEEKAVILEDGMISKEEILYITNLDGDIIHEEGIDYDSSYGAYMKVYCETDPHACETAFINATRAALANPDEPIGAFLGYMQRLVLKELGDQALEDLNDALQRFRNGDESAIEDVAYQVERAGAAEDEAAMMRSGLSLVMGNWKALGIRAVIENGGCDIRIGNLGLGMEAGLTFSWGGVNIGCSFLIELGGDKGGLNCSEGRVSVGCGF